MELINIKTNKFQTSLTEELKEALPREVWEELIDSLTSIKFIQNLIAPEEVRGYAKDRPKEEDFYNDGRIKVDVTNPHILEDMDFFRERAIFFSKHGKYTHLIPNGNPKSEYAEFWREELRRWKDGLVRPSDGEWIPGSLYFYWNYVNIWLVEEVESQATNTRRKRRGERIRNFPKVWLGDYLFFHYFEQAMNEGRHIKVLKTRGCGVSFKMASVSPRNMYVYPGSGNSNYHLASDRGFLTGDKGIWGKILDNLDWIAEHTPLPKMRLVDKRQQVLELQLGYSDEYGVRKGLLSSVHGISLKDNPDKARGIRGRLIHYEEDGLFPHLEKAWGVNRKAVEDGDVNFGVMAALGCLTENNYVWTNNGDFKLIKDLKQDEGIIGFDIENGKPSKEKISYWQPPQEKECLRIELNSGRYIECSKDHPLLHSYLGYQTLSELPNVNGKRRRKSNKKVSFIEAQNLKVGQQLAIAEEIPIFNTKRMWNPRLIGWLIGDGSYGFDKTPVLSNCESEINSWIESNLNTTLERSYITKEGKIYKETRIKGICPELRKIGIYGQTKEKKKLPVNIHSYCKEDICEFIGGLFDTDGYISKKGRISFSTAYKSLALEVLFLLQKIGVHGKIRFIKPNFKNPKDKAGHYKLEIADKKSVLKFAKEIKLFPKEKQKRLDSFVEYYRNIKGLQTDIVKGIRFERIISIKNIGKKPVYNLTASTTNTYLGNGIITHNTGGVMGSSFEGSEKLFYSPLSFNIHGLPNVYDRNSHGETICGFFWGAYLNRNNCFDTATGEPDIIKALVEILLDRYEVKYNSTDLNAITQKKAEEPITPQEAVMRTTGTIFPVADIKEYMEEIGPRKEAFFAEHHVGELVSTSNGDIIFKEDITKVPLRKYHLDGNMNKTGAVEIFEMPKRTAEGVIVRGRYLAGADTIDSDTGGSLFSMFVFDTFTKRIVAEYTGRPRLASEAYEISLRLVKFYNAELNYENNLKGLFTYYDNANALHYLCDTPQILRDMDLVKGPSTYGNAKKGTRANKEINSYGRLLYAEYLINPAYNQDNKLNLHTMRSWGALEETIYYNSDGNFDRISALGMLFILVADRVKRTQSLSSRESTPTSKLANDPFFTKHFKSKNAIDTDFENKNNSF